MPRLTKEEYKDIYNNYSYILDILGNANGALFLKDLTKLTKKKSYSQICKDIIKLEELEILKIDKTNSSKIIRLSRKAWKNFFDKDNKPV